MEITAILSFLSQIMLMQNNGKKYINELIIWYSEREAREQIWNTKAAHKW